MNGFTEYTLAFVCCLWTFGRFDAESKAVVPPFMKTCRKTDPHINDCVRESLESLLPSLKDGVKALDVPPIDPLSLDELTLSLGSGNVDLGLTLTGIVIRGLSRAEVVSVKTNVEDGKLEISTRTPELEFAGQYSAEGGVHNLPLGGHGAFKVSMVDVTSVWMVYYLEADHLGAARGRLASAPGDDPGSGGMEVEAFALEIMPSKVSYHFDHFLDGDNGLGTAVNSFLNENAHEVFNDVKAQLLRQLGKAFQDVANALLFNFREDQIWKA